MKSLKPELVDLGALIVAVLIVIFIVSIGVFNDFDLYYYGGKVERVSTYSDTPQVRHVADLAEHPIEKNEDGVYGSPVLVALVFQPLSFFPREVAELLWSAVCFLALVVAFKLAVGQHWQRWLFLACVMCGTVVGFYLGQVSLMTNSLLFLTYALLQRGKSTWAGVALGIAAAIKIYPAFLLVVLLVLKNWKAVKSFVITVVGLSLLTIPALGVSDVPPALRWTWRVATSPSVRHVNVSVPSLIGRVADSPHIAFYLSVLMLCGSIVLLYLYRSVAPARLFALGAVCMLLSQNITWESYTTLALIGVLALRGETLSKSYKYVVIVGYLLVAFWYFLVISDVTWGMYQTAGMVLITGVLLRAMQSTVKKSTEDLALTQ